VLALTASRPDVWKVSPIATLTIRNLPEATRRALKERAARNNRSMEAEVRAILEGAVDNGPNFVGDWLKATDTLRGEPLELPVRSLARTVDPE
jgi:antitoxin FitA